MKLSYGMSAAALSLGLLLPGVASAGLVGADVNASWNFSSVGSLYTNYGDTTVGAGTEYTDINVDGAIFFDVDIADESITVNFDPTYSSFTSSVPFNGLFITDLNDVFGTLSVVSVVASGFTFLASDVIFNSDGFGLDFQGDAFADGGSVTVYFSDVAPVPLPAAFPVLLSALGGLGALKLRRKRA